MADLLPHSPPLFLTGIFHGHPGVSRELAAIPATDPSCLPLLCLVGNIETKTSGTKERADTTANAFGADFFPEILILETGL